MRDFSKDDLLQLEVEYGVRDVRRLELLFWDTKMSLINFERCLDAIRDCRFRIAEEGVERFHDGAIHLPWKSAAWSDMPMHLKHRLFFTDFLFFPESFQFSDNFKD